jgi:GNAT superfamily N-acetyltransferase
LPGTEIRPARSEDAAAAAALYLRARKAAEPAVPALVHDDADVHRFFRDVVLVERELWLAVDGEELVALLVLDGDWVDQLYVEPDRTGAGIGSLLVEHAKRQRPDGLRLWTFQSNAGAHRFYERHGFVAVERTDGSGNEEGAPDVRYEWPDGPENGRS